MDTKWSHRGWRYAVLASLLLLASIAPASDDVRVWGRNEVGQLGLGTTDGIPHPTPVSVPGLANVVKIKGSAPGGGGMAEGRSLALLSNGTVMGWGRNSDGEVGIGSAGPPVVSPTQVVNLAQVLDICAGSYTSYAVLSNGTVKSWGSGTLGAIGDGASIARPSPVLVSGLTNVTSVAAGQWFALALLQNGTVRAWGYNGVGQLGIGATGGTHLTPEAVTGLTNVKAIAAGRSISLALLNDGTVRAWGDSISTPVTVAGLTNVVAIEAGLTAMALLGDGTVKLLTWSGGSVTAASISGLTNVAAIAMGRNHSLALLQNGTMLGWGPNTYGEVGDGTTTPRNTPVVIPGLSNVVAISAGHFHSLALTSATLNLPPLVGAGQDASVALPAAASLAGFARDDGRPNPPGTLTLAWSKVSGPGTAIFGNAAAAVTTASFSRQGVYVLQLSASDGALTSTSTVTITCSGHWPGDVNDDGVVNVDDLNLVISNFGRTYP